MLLVCRYSAVQSEHACRVLQTLTGMGKCIYHYSHGNINVINNSALTHTTVRVAKTASNKKIGNRHHASSQSIRNTPHTPLTFLATTRAIANSIARRATPTLLVARALCILHRCYIQRRWPEITR